MSVATTSKQTRAVAAPATARSATAPRAVDAERRLLFIS